MPHLGGRFHVDTTSQMKKLCKCGNIFSLKKHSEKTPEHELCVECREQRFKQIRLKLWLKQGKVCAICLESITLENSNIDHDHFSDMIRGLLCTGCNVALGSFRDSIDAMERAIKYLMQPTTKYNYYTGVIEK